MSTCLICLQELTEEDFERGEAVYLDCGCKGENSARHASCAREWFRTKGDDRCEICKALVSNVVPATELLPEDDSAPENREDDSAPENRACEYMVRCCVHLFIIGLIFYVFLSRAT